MMRIWFYSSVLLIMSACATHKDIKKRLLPEGIKSATEQVYEVTHNEKKLLWQKEMVFTRNGRIKYSKTVDAEGNLVQETRKKLWFVVESYPDKEPYYCKTRWQPNQRERISCYTRKKYKQNEAIYHYTTDGTMAKIVDHFPPFYTEYFYYTDRELTKMVVKDKNEQLIDEVLISCVAKDEKGTCLKEIRISTKTNHKKEIDFTPKYE